MPDDTVIYGLNLIEKHLSRKAVCRIHFDRDETDSYIIDVQPITSVYSSFPTKEQVLPLLPAGSHWDAARGWRSFFGVPFSTPDESWIVLGCEGVIVHRTRGSYPVFRGFLFPARAIPERELLEMANEITSATEGHVQRKSTYGIIESSSQSQEKHKQIEAWIIRRAVTSYHAGIRLLFRTLLLSEHQIPSRRTGIDYSYFLIATAPAIRERFSWRTRAWLKLYETLNDNP